MTVHLLQRDRQFTAGTRIYPKRGLRARQTQAGTFVSLDDPLFDGMFHGDGSNRRPGTCFCGQETSDVEGALCRTCLAHEPEETSDVEEALCRTCLAHEPEAVFQPESPITADLMQDAGVRLAAAAAAARPGAVTTPTALRVRRPHISPW